jgi:hypothetical protein
MPCDPSTWVTLVHSSGGAQDSLAQQIDCSRVIHSPLQQLQPGDVALSLPVAVYQRQASWTEHERVQVKEGTPRVLFLVSVT